MSTPFDPRSGAAASEHAQRAYASERPLDGFAAYWAANKSHPLRQNQTGPKGARFVLREGMG